MKEMLHSLSLFLPTILTKQNLTTVIPTDKNIRNENPV